MGTMGEGQPQTLSQDSLRELAAEKEREWREVQQLSTQSLEAALHEVQEELRGHKDKFNKLKEDFKYNLRLLGERDAELDRYDSMAAELKTQLTVKEADLSDCKIKIDELKTAAAREAYSREELQRHYQQRVREKQAELDQYRCEKDADLQKERAELETFKRNLERQLRELEEELDVQRRELTAGFEDALRKREHEFRLQADDMSSTVLAHEMKVKLLSKELEIVRGAQDATAQEFEHVDNNHRQLEKQLKQKEWQIQDLTAIKDARIAELEGKQQQTEASMKRLQEDFQRKYADMDRRVTDKEAALAKTRDAAQERDRLAQDEVRRLQAKVEDTDVKLRQAEWTTQDLHRDKDARITSLQEELSDVKTRWDAHVAEMSRSNVSRDLELEALRDMEAKVKCQLLQKQEDIDRYKKELTVALEREAQLERSKAQLELDWQRRYDDVERAQYERSEDLVRSLTTSRDQALATVKEREREVDHQCDLTKVLTKDRDQVLATLRHHGLTVDRNIDLTRFRELPENAADQLLQLEEQNENLRAVVKSMRKQMESLGDQMPETTTAASAGGGSGDSGRIARDYVKNLEGELHKVKSKFRKLEQEVKDNERSNVKVTGGEDKVIEAAGDNVYLKAHVEQLNSSIGQLRGEKVELTTQLRKQQARVLYLESSVDQLTKQPQEKQAELQQLHYELGAQGRRYQAEVASLQNRLRELELQVVESRREADEYHKDNVKHNLEATQLRNQLSQMKMDLAEGRPSVNFGAQELLIQQLQDEIQRSRLQHKGADGLAAATGRLTFDPQERGQGFSQLQQKLRQAAKHIAQLAREKQQLIEMGNRLRAQLQKNGVRPPSPSGAPAGVAGPSTVGSSNLQLKIHNKLQQLEKLQYQLTKQELAVGHQKELPTRDSNRAPASARLSDQDSDSHEREDEDDEDDEEYRPQSILKKPGWSQSVHRYPREPASTAGSGAFRPRTAPELAQPAPSVRPLSARSPPSTYRPASPTRGTRDYGQLLASMTSSGGGESLQELWQMLDNDEGSPRPFTPLNSGGGAGGPFSGLQFPGDHSTEPGNRLLQAADGWTIKGERTSTQPKPAPSTRDLSPRTSGKAVRKAKTSRKPGIRNWNVKPDTAVK